MTSLEINNIFSYHVPKEIEGKEAQSKRYETIRELGKQFAYAIKDNCPEAADTDEAIKFIRMAVMFANASIAINEK